MNRNRKLAKRMTFNYTSRRYKYTSEAIKEAVNEPSAPAPKVQIVMPNK